MCVLNELNPDTYGFTMHDIWIILKEKKEELHVQNYVQWKFEDYMENQIIQHD